jgi:indolepyruvate ferredoxin oxidoreductase beta subunit
MEYPTIESIVEAIQRLGGHVLTFDASELALQAGSSRSANVAMLGGLFALQKVDVTERSLFQAIEERWPARLVEINRKAYQLGHDRVIEKTR